LLFAIELLYILEFGDFMKKFNLDFQKSIDDIAWHNERYQYPFNKLLHEFANLKKQIELYYNFDLLDDSEYKNLIERIREYLSKQIIYKHYN